MPSWKDDNESLIQKQHISTSTVLVRTYCSHERDHKIRHELMKGHIRVHIYLLLHVVVLLVGWRGSPEVMAFGLSNHHHHQRRRHGTIHHSLSSSSSSSSWLQPFYNRSQRFTTTLLFASNNNEQPSSSHHKDDDDDDMGGLQRGLPLGVLALAISIWCFSIPPELRRAHWCMSDRCTQHRSLPSCYDCVTFGEWKSSIVDYYANGGRIQWDFSVAEETKQLFSGTKR